MELTTLSQHELKRLEIIQSVIDKRLSVVNAAKLIGISRSQMHRILKRYRRSGASGIASQKRGKPSNRKIANSLREYALFIVRSNYHDFGPTFAAEKLRECHDFDVSKETLRKWMIEDGLWEPRINRKRRVHQPRNRRDCFGELVQIDGSHHHWFEDRGAKSALLVYVDDATGKLLHLRFAQSENAFDYFQATKSYLAQYGKPIAFYSDKHGVFRTTHGSKKGNTNGMTQFGRALDELNIDIICANSPQAKGRVERANKTLQDRLVKELRLQGINTIDAANTFAPYFIEDYNLRFGKEPRHSKDLHRPLADHENLDGAMCHKFERTLTKALTLRYDKVLFVLEPSDVAINLAGQRVIVCDYPDGRLEIHGGGVSLPYRTFDKLRTVKRAKVVENKRLDEVLSYISEQQSKRPLKRSGKAPRRTGQTGHMFSV